MQETVNQETPNETVNEQPKEEKLFTQEEVNALLPEWTDLYNTEYGTQWVPLPSVKDYAGSPADLQKLLWITNPYG